MIVRLAIRSLVTRPLRTAVLSIGFGLSIAVMAELLGVGEVILEQAHSPALAGGGDVVVAGAAGPLDNARFLSSMVLGSDRFASRVVAVSPTRRASLSLLSANVGGPVTVHGGIPSREQGVGDPEVSAQPGWRDDPADARWTNPQPGDLLRALDRFHPLPRPADEGDRATATTMSARSWAEWLYFNGRSADGTRRFYLTFMTGAPDGNGMRPAFVRLQLNRNGTTRNFAAAAPIRDADVVDRAPEIDVAGNTVRVSPDGQYQIALDLEEETAIAPPRHSPGRSAANATGTLTLIPVTGRSMPPATIHGARGWLSGYVVPVLSGTFHGTLRVGGEEVPIDGMAGYHDHNWGYWEGVSWQWGQVAAEDLSIVYGRVFPPADVADPARVPGFLGVIGKDGPLAFSTDITIREDDENGRPKAVTVQSRDRRLTMTLRLDVAESVQTAMRLTRDAAGAEMNFLQLGGMFRVTGHAAGRDIDFSARGSAETFRSPR